MLRAQDPSTPPGGPARQDDGREPSSDTGRGSALPHPVDAARSGEVTPTPAETTRAGGSAGDSAVAVHPSVPLIGATPTAAEWIADAASSREVPASRSRLVPPDLDASYLDAPAVAAVPAEPWGTSDEGGAGRGPVSHAAAALPVDRPDSRTADSSRERPLTGAAPLPTASVDRLPALGRVGARRVRDPPAGARAVGPG